jgi:hypothetical protein
MFKKRKESFMKKTLLVIMGMMLAMNFSVLPLNASDVEEDQKYDHEDMREEAVESDQEDMREEAVESGQEDTEEEPDGNDHEEKDDLKSY